MSAREMPARAAACCQLPSFSHYVSHDLRPAILRGDIPFGRLYNGSQARAIVRFVEIQNMLDLVEVGIEIERRRQTPPLRREEKSMVA